MALLTDKQVGININIMKGGCEYRWHYDRNALTAILYLNEVAGGATEIHPNYRLCLKGQQHSKLQRVLDALLQLNFIRCLFSRKQSVVPRPGRLVIMRGDRCLHSVSSVEGEQERINLILAYDHPGADFPVAKCLNSYVYTQDAAGAQDPNYLG
ncbi:MAG: 2OG-Fe(II) oxygenase [Synechococcales bacterium]|nr:2OG-Fe(II) oxygenase [Synechococcales bacterium]